MKRIISTEQKQKKAKRDKLLVGVILVGIMIMSTVGFAIENNLRTGTDSLGNKVETVSYNGITFTKDVGSDWVFPFGASTFVTKNLPQNVSKIDFKTQFSLESYRNKPLYTAGDGDAVYEISRNLQPFASRVQKACLSGEKCNDNSPEKNCTDDNIIVVKEAGNGPQSVSQKDNCIYVIANLNDQYLYADKFIFSLLGI